MYRYIHIHGRASFWKEKSSRRIQGAWPWNGLTAARIYDKYSVGPSIGPICDTQSCGDDESIRKRNNIYPKSPISLRE